MLVTREDIFAMVPGAESVVADATDGRMAPGSLTQLVSPSGCFQLQIAKMCADAAGCARPLVLGVAEISVRTDLMAEMLRSPAIYGQTKFVIFADVDREQELFCSLLPYLTDCVTLLLVEERFLPQAVTVEFNWLPRKAFIAAMRDVFSAEPGMKFTYDAGVGDALYSASSGCPELALALMQKCAKAKRKNEFIMNVTDSVSTIKKATSQLYNDISNAEEISLEAASAKIREFVQNVPWKSAYVYFSRELMLDSLAAPSVADKVGTHDLLLKSAVTSEAQFAMLCLKLAIAARKNYGHSNVSGSNEHNPDA